MDKSLMADIAANAMDELISLLQGNESIWINSGGGDDREVLNLDSYERIFPRPNAHFIKNPNIRIEASRDSGRRCGQASVDIFTDVNKWMEFFPTILLKARTIEVMSSFEMVGRQSGPMQLMYEELQVLSALVPTRQLYLLRFCQQIKQGTWAIVDVSYQDRILFLLQGACYKTCLMEMEKTRLLESYTDSWLFFLKNHTREEPFQLGQIFGTIMTTSKDIVKPPLLPDSWKLKEIFTTGVVIGTYLAMMTLIFFYLMHKTHFFPE